MKYKHTQIGHLMIITTLAVAALFVWVYMTAANEPASVDSGSNVLVSAVMVLTLGFLASFTYLRVSVDEEYLSVIFGYGIYRKRFPLRDIASVRAVKNHWYYGWGIKWWPSPKMWIYSVSGFHAVEVILNNGKRYRIGTDEPKQLEEAIKQVIQSNV